MRRGAVVLGLLVWVSSVPASALFGGPDAEGYSFSDTDEADGFQPAYHFVDIRTNGTSLVLKDDEVSGAVSLGFAFDWYGASYTSVHVSSNGFLTFLAGQPHGCCEGGEMPSNATPNAVIAGYWADLHAHPDVGASIRHATLGSAPARTFVLQFTDAIHVGCTSCKATFQFQLFEATDIAQVHYLGTLSDGSVHAIGFEDEAGDVGLTYKRGTFAGDGPRNQSAVQFAPNRAPARPTVTGTTTFPYGHAMDFTVVARDPERLAMNVTVAWGDGLSSTFNQQASAVPFTASHSWTNPGDFTISVTASDHFAVASPSGTLNVTVTNAVPSRPTDPSGPTTLPHNATGTYTSRATDPEGFQLTYTFHWGDGTTTDVTADSGATAEAGHAWATVGAFQVRVTVTDERDATNASLGSLLVTTTNTAPLAPLRPTLQVAPYAACIYTFVAPSCQQLELVYGTSACQRAYAEVLDLSPALGPLLGAGTNAPRSAKVPFCFAVPPDPDDDALLWVDIDWGDGTATRAHVFREGVRWYANELHGYAQPGTYLVTATTRDSYGAPAGASPPYAVTVL